VRTGRQLSADGQTSHGSYMCNALVTEEYSRRAVRPFDSEAANVASDPALAATVLRLSAQPSWSLDP
jgi:hypothetical protein